MELGTETIDLVGYAASAVVLFSFFMKNIIRLRTVNSIGCGLFLVYGFLFDTPNLPIIITNAGILMVNGYYLFFKRAEKHNQIKEKK